MISVHTDAQGFIICRMHEAFQSAPGEVLRALRSYLLTRRKEFWAPVAEFAQTITLDPPRQVKENRVGRVYDLGRLREAVNAEWFDSTLDVRISWGRNPKRRSGKRNTSIEFGSYTKAINLIRIHPRLDDCEVPEAFVRFVIYHEMLHVKIPPHRENGRWIYHPPAFREAEKRFPEFSRMEQIAARILDRL